MLIAESITRGYFNSDGNPNHEEEYSNDNVTEIQTGMVIAVGCAVLFHACFGDGDAFVHGSRDVGGKGVADGERVSVCAAAGDSELLAGAATSGAADLQLGVGGRGDVRLRLERSAAGEFGDSAARRRALDDAVGGKDPLLCESEGGPGHVGPLPGGDEGARLLFPVCGLGGGHFGAP